MKQTAILWTLASSLMFCACNGQYDLAKLDTKMQLLPGIEVNVNPSGETTQVKASDFIGDSGLAENSIVKSNDKFEAKVSEQAMKEGQTVNVPGTFTFDMGSVPEYLKHAKNAIKFSDDALISFTVTNPLSVAVSLSYTMVVDKKDRIPGKTQANIPANSTQTVNININDYLNKVPGVIEITELTLKGTPGTKAGDCVPAVQVNAEETVTFGNGLITLPAKMGKDSEFYFNYTYEFKEDFKLDLSEYDIDVNAKKFEIKASVKSNLPVKLDAYTTDGSDATASISTITIKSAEEWAEFTLFVDAPNGLTDLKKVCMEFHATALGDIDFKSTDYAVEFKAETLKLSEGIEIK